MDPVHRNWERCLFFLICGYLHKGIRDVKKRGEINNSKE
jgi:hypothetical protein